MENPPLNTSQTSNQWPIEDAEVLQNQTDSIQA